MPLMQWMPSYRQEPFQGTEIPCLQIIQELEQSKRGIYGGAIGYVDFTEIWMCIAIRLVYKKKMKSVSGREPESWQTAYRKRI